MHDVSSPPLYARTTFFPEVAIFGHYMHYHLISCDKTIRDFIARDIQKDTLKALGPQHARIQRVTGGPDPPPPEKSQKYGVS